MTLFGKTDIGLKEHIDTCEERYQRLEAKFQGIEDKLTGLSSLFDQNLRLFRRIYLVTTTTLLLIVFAVLAVIIWTV